MKKTKRMGKIIRTLNEGVLKRRKGGVMNFYVFRRQIEVEKFTTTPSMHFRTFGLRLQMIWSVL